MTTCYSTISHHNVALFLLDRTAPTQITGALSQCSFWHCSSDPADTGYVNVLPITIQDYCLT